MDLRDLARNSSTEIPLSKIGLTSFNHYGHINDKYLKLNLIIIELATFMGYYMNLTSSTLW